jgi:hypothetical protein
VAFPAPWLGSACQPQAPAKEGSSAARQWTSCQLFMCRWPSS